MLQALPHTTWNTPRSPEAALALWLCFGTIGIHRAYLNRQHWITMFLAGCVGWLTASLGAGLVLLAPVAIFWLADGFRLTGWVADHNAVISRTR